MDTSSWFVRLAVFVLILVVLDRFFSWNISIIGSLVVTGLVYFSLQALERWRSDR
jgi:FtsH-binding integral membrane protein